jgi:uncharacterized protein
LAARDFRSPEAFRPKSDSYRLLPFRFIRLDSGCELLVNEAGEYLIAPQGTAHDLIRHQLDQYSVLYQRLRARHFVFDACSSPLLDVLATKYRTKRSFLDGFTKLHMFVTTLRCEHSCHYCQVSRQTTDRTKYDMSEETARRSVDLMFRNPARDLTLEFQGGEPLLNFPLIQFTVALAKEKAAVTSKGLKIVVATNLALATDDILRYFRNEGIFVSTSLDGPAFIHNANRPRPGGNSHELTIKNIQRARDIVGMDRVSALMTTTQLSLDHPIEIIDEYLRLKFRSIFLRSISPYGFAIRSKRKTGYHMDRFVSFYRRGLEYILKINRAGTPFAEVFAKLILTKILTPFATGFVDLQSPPGLGISAVSYNYDGSVYASDESRMLAEMGDTRFRLGDVHTNSYEEIFFGSRLEEAIRCGIVESLPGCADCAFQNYCGADPVFHYASQGDPIGHRPTSAFCHRNMSIFHYLFSLIGRNDPDVDRIFFAWIRDQSPRKLSELVTCQ